ncbi:MAG: hypothetical protein HY600_05715 [Candidatus Omnitrophica bacterium]|nr:hypothetical protein [Candidatus Omnitrophota bacterium]
MTLGPLGRVGLVVVICQVAGPAGVGAGPPPAPTTLRHSTIVSAGGWLTAGPLLTVFTAVGLPFGGAAGEGVAPPPGGTRMIVVEGTTNDATASVDVNGIAALLTGAVFRAEGILLTEGPNLIRVTATDPAGNQATQTITVFLDTRPPARPTMARPPVVTTQPTVPLQGTKTPGTAIWINGVEVISLSEATSWTATVLLGEGDNPVVVVARDAAGNESTALQATIVVDAAPPVITVTAPAKTNVTPFLLDGTVDDSLTRVQVNEQPVAAVNRRFHLPVPLAEGPNLVTITATSPNGHVATRALTITRGTIPTIVSAQPTGGRKLYAEVSQPIQAVVTDKEGDPIVVRFLLDGQELRPWSPLTAHDWIPSALQFGPRTLEIQAKDEDGGEAARPVPIYILRKPIRPQ